MAATAWQSPVPFVTDHSKGAAGQWHRAYAKRKFYGASRMDEAETAWLEDANAIYK